LAGSVALLKKQGLMC